jgi:chemotaxis protein methyltransferase CheR
MTAGAFSNPAYESLAQLVSARTGLRFAPDRRDHTEVAIRRAMARSEVADVDRYLALVEVGGRLFDDLVAELTVGETYFFRDPQHFEFLRHEALPALGRRRGGGHVLRVWSAGCASGEEPYSLAILLEETGSSEQASVLGTDISRAALARASEAVYGAWSLRGVDEALVRRYFRPAGNRYVLDDRIRHRVTFGSLNLMRDPFPCSNAGGDLDVVLCRNVLIYFEPEAVRWVARRLFESLAEGGWLVTGPSDPPLGELAPYESVVTPAGVFYRRGGRQGALSAGNVRGHGTVVVSPAPLENRLGPKRCEPAADRDSVRGDVAGVAASGLDRLAAAQAPGDQLQALEVTAGPEGGPAAAADRVRALADENSVSEAARSAEEAIVHHPLSAELHLLYALLLVELGRDEEAAVAARRAVYLDRSQGTAHLVLGSILRRRGDPVGAWRCVRNARQLLGGPPGPSVPPGGAEETGVTSEATP